jgi:hypothetical protein
MTALHRQVARREHVLSARRADLPMGNRGMRIAGFADLMIETVNKHANFKASWSGGRS